MAQTPSQPNPITAVQIYEARPDLVAFNSKEAVRDELAKMRAQLEEVLPAQIDPDRFLRVCASSIIRSERLMESTKVSIYTALIEAAQLGLEPTGLLGSAYLVPYRRTVEVEVPRGNGTVKIRHWITEAKLIPGYRGLIDLARRSGEIAAIRANVVRQRDLFSILQGSAPAILHEPFLPSGGVPGKTPTVPSEDQDPGPYVGAYMVAELKGGMQQIEWMTFDEIEAVRRRSKAAEDGPWITDWSEMARKTVVRRGSKYLPLTTELQRALELDEEAERSAEAPVQGTAARQSRTAALEALRRRAGVGVESESLPEGETAPGPSSEPAEDAGEAPPDPVAAEDAGPLSICSANPPDELGMVEACQMAPGHAGRVHKSSEGTWPV